MNPFETEHYNVYFCSNDDCPFHQLTDTTTEVLEIIQQVGNNYNSFERIVSKRNLCKEESYKFYLCDTCVIQLNN